MRNKQPLSAGALCGLALLGLVACAGEDATPVADSAPPLRNEAVYVPARDPDARGLEERRRLQEEAAADSEVFRDFTFTDRLPQSGITFRNHVVDDLKKRLKPVHYDHGNAIATADVDGDGLQDLYFTTQLGPNELWRNLGEGRFENITEPGIAMAERISVGASFADADNDGDPDLYVTTVKMGNVLFENQGDGRFEDVSAGSGVDYLGHSSGAVFFDYDSDGLLDLLVVNVGVYTTEERGEGGYYVGLDDAFSGHLFPERREHSRLYHNNGDLTFTDVTTDVGLDYVGFSGDASAVDLSGDRFPDLYVLNMQGNDQYYENLGGQRLQARGRELFPRTPWGAMGIKFFDWDNDGDLDLFLTDMHSDMSENIRADREALKSRMQWGEDMLQTGGASIFGNAFFANRGDGRFDEISDEIGAENYWPWGLSVGDLNADGYQDAFLASSMSYPYRYGPNSLLLNEKGERFVDAAFLVGVEPRRDGKTYLPWFDLDCGGTESSHELCRGQPSPITVWGAAGTRSSAILDLDRDGDLDIVTNEFGDEPQILISDLSSRKEIHFLEIDLEGTTSNRDGVGAKVWVESGGATQYRYNDGKSGYLSQSVETLWIGLGDATSVGRIRIVWPSGTEQTLSDDIPIDSRLEIREPS